MTRATTVPHDYEQARQANNPGNVTKFVLGPPAGEDPTGEIRPIEALAEQTPDGVIQRFYFAVDEDDIARLQVGACIELSIMGPRTYPFDVMIWHPRTDVLGGVGA